MEGMEDYPRNQAEFESRFATEAACEAYLVRLRWPDGFVCPRCRGRQGWVTQRGLVVCKDCGYQSSLRAGTIFEGSRKPLGLWFRAMWYLTGAKNGASAVTIQRVLGLGSYQTAWTWLHKLRRAMVTPGREHLRGDVEVDETFIGAPEEGRHGRRMLRKTMVVVAAERKTKGIGRIRMRRVPDGKAKSLHPFVLDGIEPGSILHTDDWQGYAGLETKGYRRQATNIARSGQDASEVLPGVHRVVSLLKRWLMGTHQGAVSHEHLDYYLDEFTFRFNRRTSRSRGKLFYRLMQNAVRVPPTPYQELIHGIRGRTPKANHNI
jgi:transposase-like protein